MPLYNDPTIDEQFRDALGRLERDARDLNLSLTDVCSEAGHGRSTHYRYRESLPAPVVILADMQRVVKRKREAALAGPRKR